MKRSISKILLWIFNIIILGFSATALCLIRNFAGYDIMDRFTYYYYPVQSGYFGINFTVLILMLCYFFNSYLLFKKGTNLYPKIGAILSIFGFFFNIIMVAYCSVSISSYVSYTVEVQKNIVFWNTAHTFFVLSGILSGIGVIICIIVLAVLEKDAEEVAISKYASKNNETRTYGRVETVFIKSPNKK